MPEPERKIPKFQRFLVQWMPFGCAAGLTLHSVLASNLLPAVFLAFGTGLTSLWVVYSQAFMKEVEREVEKLGEQHARLLIGLLKVLRRTIINQTISVLPLPYTPKARYCKHLQYSYRGLTIEGIHLNKPRALQDVFVEVYLSPRDRVDHVPTGLLRQRYDDKPQNNIGYYLAQMPKSWQSQRLAILGAPGSGKTTLMRYVALMYALRIPYRLHPKAPQYLPVLLYLRDICKEILQNPNVKLTTIVTQWANNLLETKPLNLPEGWFADQLGRNQCLVMLDGLDEVANAGDRQAVSCWVDRQMNNYPDTSFILTSRPLGYQEAQLRTAIQVLEIQSLTKEQIEQFVWNWFDVTESKRHDTEDDVIAHEEAHQQAKGLLAEVEKQPNLSELVSNPLLLTLTAKTYHKKQGIPLRKVKLYRTICQVMLDDLPQWKGRSCLSYQEKLSILQPFALSLMRRGTRSFTLEEAEPVFTEHLGKLHDAPTTMEFLTQLQAVDALIAKEREGDYEFAHLSFQEYLAALELKDTNQQQDLLAALHAKGKLAWWAETMRFYATLQADITPLIEAILQEWDTAQQFNLEKSLFGLDLCQEGSVEKKVREDFLCAPLKGLNLESHEIVSKLQPHNYFKLAHYLQTEQWKVADIETFYVMGQIMEGWSIESLKEFPGVYLRMIDQLWLKHSQGRFGFSVQKQIWVEVGGKLDYGADVEAADKAYEKLLQELKWNEKIRPINPPRLDVDAHLPVGRGWGKVAKNRGVWLGALLSHSSL
ncbi:MAG: NACHT domain-containing protein [Spirulina sp. SIO3F2]|nr:NACHT domain-containing protein [Spirulina sp. SIO3F2]